MAIRVDREVFDAVGAGVQAGGLRVYEDGTRQAPWQPRPFMSQAEYIITNSMRLMSIPADEIRANVQAPPPAGGLFPEQFGYDRTPLTVEEVLDTDRWAPQRRSWVGGVVRKPRLTDYQEDMWSGTTRNSMPSSSPMG